MGPLVDVSIWEALEMGEAKRRRMAGTMPEPKAPEIAQPRKGVLALGGRMDSMSILLAVLATSKYRR